MNERWISGDRVDPVTDLESRLRIAEARVEELEMLLIEASCIRPGVHVPMLQCVCGAGRPCEEVVRILARSTKGGANG